MLHLKQAEVNPYESDVLLSSKGCCINCDMLDGVIISLDDAYSINPLPSKNCVRPKGCVCRYVLIPSRDDTGNLIMKK